MQITGAVLERSGAPAPFAESRPFTVGPARARSARTAASCSCASRRPACATPTSASSTATGVRPTADAARARGRGHRRGRRARASTTSPPARASCMTFLPRCGDCAGCRTDGRLPCEVGSAANAAGTLVGGGIRLHRAAADGSAQDVHHHLGRQRLRDARRGQPHVGRARRRRRAGRDRRAARLRGADRRRRRDQRGRPAPGSRVIVVGLGGVGMAALLVAVALGHEVIGVDAVDAKLELARELGAAAALQPRRRVERRRSARPRRDRGGRLRARVRDGARAHRARRARPSRSGCPPRTRGRASRRCSSPPRRAPSSAATSARPCRAATSRATSSSGARDACRWSGSCRRASASTSSMPPWTGSPPAASCASSSCSTTPNPSERTPA